MAVLSALLPLAYATAAGRGDLPALTPGSLPDMLLAPVRLTGGAVLALLGLVVGVAGEAVALVASVITLTQHHVAVQPATGDVAHVLIVVPLAVGLQGRPGCPDRGAAAHHRGGRRRHPGVGPRRRGRPARRPAPSRPARLAPVGALDEPAAVRTAPGALGAGTASLLVLAYAIALVAGTVILDRRREL